MPNYDFKCTACGHRFTKQMNISARKEAVCVKCGSKQLEQLFRCCNILGGKGGSFTDVGGETGPSMPSSCAGGCSGCSGC